MFGWLKRRKDPFAPATAAESEQPEIPLAAEGSDPGPPMFDFLPPRPPPPPVLPIVWLPGDEPPRVTLLQAGAEPLTLCPQIEATVPDIAWFANHEETDPAFPAQDERLLVTLAPVTLFRLPPDTVVYGTGNFVTSCGDYFLAEQFPPGPNRDPIQVDTIAPIDLSVVQVDHEVLLVGRFGIERWECWLTELLPKIVLVERACPDRFVYLLPAEVTQVADQGTIWSNIAQSLAACGIDPERVLAAEPEFSYRFAALHAVTPVWSNDMLHPQAGQAVRDACAAIAPALRRRVAIHRTPTPGQGIVNRDEINAILQLRGFAPMMLASLPFTDQVSLFKGASAIFAELGSDLAGLLFAAAGVRVITAAPRGFDTWFFHGLVREREGRIADLRGPVIERRGFALNPDDLNAALDGL